MEIHLICDPFDSLLRGTSLTLQRIFIDPFFNSWITENKKKTENSFKFNFFGGCGL
jgi:hypothetical protein